MDRRLFLAFMALVGGAGRAFAGGGPPSAEEHARTIAALRPRRTGRPVVAVLGHHEGAEITDLMVPYGILHRSDVARVLVVGTRRSPFILAPLTVRVHPHMDIRQFSSRYPRGADYVLVPAIARREDPEVVAWLRAQARLGAIIVGICSGVMTVSAAGFLRDRRGTGHWQDVAPLQKANPGMTYVPNRRYVVDRGVMTTTGVSASLPAAMALVEALSDSRKAARIAAELGAVGWGGGHDSGAFGPQAMAELRKLKARRQRLPKAVFGVPVADGVDDVALAFTLDAYARPGYADQAVAVARRRGDIVTRGGLRLAPDVTGGAGPSLMLPPVPSRAPARALDMALEDIARRYDGEVARAVALELEHPWKAGG